MFNPTIFVTSDNVDIAGSWNQHDVEAEMLDLDIQINNDTDWIDYIMDRNFADCDDAVPAEIITSIKALKNIPSTTVKFFIDGDMVVIDYVHEVMR